MGCAWIHALYFLNKYWICIFTYTITSGHYSIFLLPIFFFSYYSFVIRWCVRPCATQAMRPCDTRGQRNNDYQQHSPHVYNFTLETDDTTQRAQQSMATLHLQEKTTGPMPQHLHITLDTLPQQGTLQGTKHKGIHTRVNKHTQYIYQYNTIIYYTKHNIIVTKKYKNKKLENINTMHHLYPITVN